jgi:hypothetical protein
MNELVLIWQPLTAGPAGRRAAFKAEQRLASDTAPRSRRRSVPAQFGNLGRGGTILGCLGQCHPGTRE